MSTEMSTVIKLHCWVQGDQPDLTFSLEIAATKTVEDLKDVIKEKKKQAFRNVDAVALELWKVSILLGNFDGNPQKDKLGKTLPAWQSLSSVFLDQPANDYLSIVIKAPAVSPTAVNSELLKLICYLSGDDPRDIFSVDISATETVADLKDVIKEKNKHALQDIDAKTLDLFKVSISGDEKKTMNNVRPAEKAFLSPERKLCIYFPGGAAEDHVHIIINVRAVRLPPSSYRRPRSPDTPDTPDTMKDRKDFLDRTPSKPPSAQGKANQFSKGQISGRHGGATFHFDRPPTSVTITPLPILHPVFGKFVDDCESYDPTKEDNDLVSVLSPAMSGFFNNEDARMSKFRELMNDHGFDITASKIEGTGYQTDGDTRIGEFCSLIVEGKVEIAASGAEPLLQGAHYYLEFVRKKARDSKYTLPCFILYVFGAHIGFAGAAFTDRPILQVLTAPIPLFFHDSDTRLRVMAAKHLGALKRAMSHLRQYYTVDILATGPLPDPAYPHLTQYLSLHDNQTKCKFTYVSRLPGKHIFFGKTEEDEDICIKFVRTYSKGAHLHLASTGHAPVLRGFESVPGGWRMVVMEVLDKSYKRFDTLKGSLRPEHRSSLTEIVTSLHQKEFVHGDLRDINLWIKEISTSPLEFNLMLIDFDWSGAIAAVRYPMNIYKGPDLRRPEGASGGELILAEHDMAMVDIMFPTYDV